MGYRTYVKVVFKDGRTRTYNNVYINQTSSGFYISDYSDYRNEDFIPMSSIDQSACRKANPDSGCFISTAVYNFSPNPELNLKILRDFRDNTMLNKSLTSKMVELYYHISPPIADYLVENKTQSEFIKKHFIDNSVKLIQKMKNAEILGNKFLSWMYESCVYVIYTSGLFISWILFKIRR